MFVILFIKASNPLRSVRSITLSIKNVLVTVDSGTLSAWRISTALSDDVKQSINLTPSDNKTNQINVLCLKYILYNHKRISFPQIKTLHAGPIYVLKSNAYDKHGPNQIDYNTLNTRTDGKVNSKDLDQQILILGVPVN